MGRYLLQPRFQLVRFIIAVCALFCFVAGETKVWTENFGSNPNIALKCPDLAPMTNRHRGEIANPTLLFERARILPVCCGQAKSGISLCWELEEPKGPKGPIT